MSNYVPDVMAGYYAGLIVAAALLIYFIPTVVALLRRHHNGAAIFVLNLLLGWTYAGWVGALIWAVIR